MKPKVRSVVRAFAIIVTCSCLYSADLLAGSTIGKLFIKATTSGGGDGQQQFVDPELEECVQLMQKRPGDFILVEKESEANYLLVVVKREQQHVTDQPDDKIVYADFYLKDGDGWKLGTKLSKKTIFWNLSSRDVVAAAEKWVKRNFPQK